MPELTPSKNLPARRRALFGIVLIWLAMTAWNFHLPGLHVDEINHYAFIPGITSESAARLHHYRLPDNYFDAKDGIRQFPILGGSIYNSPATGYLGLPFFALVDHSQASVRIFSSLLALSALLTLAALVGRLFGWHAALLAGAIAATDPAVVFSARSQGVSFWPVILFWALAANFLLTASRDLEKSAWPPIACGLCLGVSALSYFVGILLAVPLIVAAAVVLLRRRRPTHLALLILAGLVAYSPMFYALLSIQLERPQLLSNFGMPQWAARDSFEILSGDNLARLKTILLGAFGSYDFVQGITGRFDRNLTTYRIPALSAAAVIAILAAIQSFALRPEQRAGLRLFLLAFAVYSAGMFVLKATSVHHLVPITVMTMMSSAWLVTIPGMVRGMAVLICSLLLVTNIAILRSAHDQLERTGGRGFHNESFSHVAPLLAGPFHQHHPVFVNWGFHLQFLFLTKGEIAYTFAEAASAEHIRELLSERERLAVVANPAVGKKILEIPGIEHEIEYEIEFSQRDGEKLFSVILLSANPTDGLPQDHSESDTP